MNLNQHTFIGEVPPDGKCDKLTAPKNGEMLCSDEKYEQGSECAFKCDPGNSMFCKPWFFLLKSSIALDFSLFIKCLNKLRKYSMFFEILVEYLVVVIP